MFFLLLRLLLNKWVVLLLLGTRFYYFPEETSANIGRLMQWGASLIF